LNEKRVLSIEDLGLCLFVCVRICLFMFMFVCFIRPIEGLTPVVDLNEKRVLSIEDLGLCLFV